MSLSLGKARAVLKDNHTVGFLLDKSAIVSWTYACLTPNPLLGFYPRALIWGAGLACLGMSAAHELEYGETKFSKPVRYLFRAAAVVATAATIIANGAAPADRSWPSKPKSVNYFMDNQALSSLDVQPCKTSSSVESRVKPACIL